MFDISAFRLHPMKMNQADGSWLETRDADRTTTALSQFMRVAAKINTRIEDELKSVGLSSPRFAILRQLLRASEAVPLRVLAEAQKCVPSNMTTLIDRLEADGLVRRIDDPSDRRSKRAQLTSLGEIRAREGIKLMSLLSSEFESAFGQEGVHAIKRAHARYIEG